jgi:hypothetical protein
MKKKKHSMIPNEYAALVAKMLQHFSNSQGELLEAGKMAAQLEAADKYIGTLICKECPSMTRRIFDALVRLGRGECLAPLIGPGASVGDTMLSEMHIVEQRRFVENEEAFPVEVLNPDGTWSTTLINPRNFTWDQRNQCTRKGPDGTRIFVYGDDQRAWAVDHRTNLSTRASRSGAPGIIGKDGFVWVGKRRFTTAEASAALADAMNPPPAVDI